METNPDTGMDMNTGKEKDEDTDRGRDPHIDRSSGGDMVMDTNKECNHTIQH